VRVAHVHRIRGIGGSERHLLTLLPALAGHGLDVSFVGLDDDGGVPETFYAELEGSRVPVVRLACPRDLDPALAVRLPHALGRLRPDLVHTHLVHADLYGALAPGARLVSTKHNPDPFRAGRFRYVERALARRAARVIAISEAVRRFSIERVGLPAGKIDVVPYGLDALPGAWTENELLPLPDRARVLLCVSRLEPQKGVETAVRALGIVRRSRPDAVLVVLGEGPERDALERLVAQLGLGGSVFLPGRVGDVATWYRRCELLVHPALWEGFGLALLEAMLAARPVVAAGGTAAEELVEDGRTGLIVHPSDPEALADALQRLLERPELAEAFGKAGLERARAEFSVERMVERTIGVYERALG
jgi:glycosyltransferase involved in cell wall biosynthesis